MKVNVDIVFSLGCEPVGLSEFVPIFLGFIRGVARGEIGPFDPIHEILDMGGVGIVHVVQIVVYHVVDDRGLSRVVKRELLVWDDHVDDALSLQNAMPFA